MLFKGHSGIGLGIPGFIWQSEVLLAHHLGLFSVIECQFMNAHEAALY